MVFGTRQRLTLQNSDKLMDIRLHDQLVKRSDTFKYLGVVLDETLSFNGHIHTSCKEKSF